VWQRGTIGHCFLPIGMASIGQAHANGSGATPPAAANLRERDGPATLCHPG
jgi:hypothetical protein